MLSVYEQSGQYQLVVSEMRPSGLGPLQLAFEQLKARLEAEGLFDEERKRPVPPVPGTVGIVTSPTGAAVRDIINVIQRRFPPARIILCPVRVQGEGAAAEIVSAIRALGEWGGADVLIVGRGGGSIEDLWAFNEEIVARAIFNCPVPVISAVGHQTDFTIADFVADLRAPTPSAAAEYAVPVALELEADVLALGQRLVRAGRSHCENASQRLDNLEPGLSYTRLLARLQRLGERSIGLEERLRRVVANRLDQGRLRWEHGRERLSALNPAAVLGRGFAVARDAQGRIVREAGTLSPGDKLRVLLSKGSLDCLVETVDPQDNGLNLPATGVVAE